VAPVRILQGAFADGAPHHDLLLSPDHPVFVDGRLICVRQLINGTTIRQATDWPSVDYLHVELDRHRCCWEGLPAEGYLDTGNRGSPPTATDRWCCIQTCRTRPIIRPARPGPARRSSGTNRALARDATRDGG